MNSTMCAAPIKILVMGSEYLQSTVLEDWIEVEKGCMQTAVRHGLRAELQRHRARLAGCTAAAPRPLPTLQVSLNISRIPLLLVSMLEVREARLQEQRYAMACVASG